MKWHMFLVAAGMLLLPQVIHSAARDCIPTRGCGKEEVEANQDAGEVAAGEANEAAASNGGKCCQRPPCEVFYYVMQQKWFLRAGLSDKTVAAVLKQEQNPQGSVDWWSEWMDEFEEERRQFGGNCPRNLFYDHPPTFAYDSKSCNLQVAYSGLDFQPFNSFEEVYEHSNSCKELILAQALIPMVERAERQSACLAGQDQGGPTHDQLWSAEYQWKKMMNDAEERLRALENQLSDYCRLCTCAPEAELARWVVQHANPPLKNPPDRKPAKKKKPKRATRKSN